jgi:hypothetical protein
MTVINTHGDSYFHYYDRTRPETRPASRLYGISHEFSRTAEDEGAGRFEVVDDPSLETPALASAPQPNAEAPPPSVTSEIRQEGTIHADSENLVSTPRHTDAATSTQEDSLKQPKDQQFERCCREIKAEIVRLQGRLDRRDERMKDVMTMVNGLVIFILNLTSFGQVFSHVTIRDSTSMKQIAWVTMVYIPPTFVAVSDVYWFFTYQSKSPYEGCVRHECHWCWHWGYNTDRVRLDCICVHRPHGLDTWDAIRGDVRGQ